MQEDGRYWGHSHRTTQAMSEEQLKAAETEATAQVEDAVEEISEEDLAGVAGGIVDTFGLGIGDYHPPQP